MWRVWWEWGYGLVAPETRRFFFFELPLERRELGWERLVGARPSKIDLCTTSSGAETTRGRDPKLSRAEEARERRDVAEWAGEMTPPGGEDSGRGGEGEGVRLDALDSERGETERPVLGSRPIGRMWLPAARLISAMRSFCASVTRLARGAPTLIVMVPYPSWLVTDVPRPRARAGATRTSVSVSCQLARVRRSGATRRVGGGFIQYSRSHPHRRGASSKRRRASPCSRRASEWSSG
jgi:hypothetical protein